MLQYNCTIHFRFIDAYLSSFLFIFFVQSVFMQAGRYSALHAVGSSKGYCTGRLQGVVRLQSGFSQFLTA